MSSIGVKLEQAASKIRQKMNGLFCYANDGGGQFDETRKPDPACSISGGDFAHADIQLFRWTAEKEE